ncbi:putative serine/threonine-protein kinase-like protein CCR3 [Cornus florida]|uniref:putative serine/threonine-protein kinase-like protein CCR3 n=1 Tax=Cornus florida TaxID=4283 RepID=UPI00289B39EC|nr:putative serine/threonine-protein kinase-like protein CCR3 [Cornus florida]
MTKVNHAVVVVVVIFTLAAVLSPPISVHGLGGSATTVAVTYGGASNATVCVIVAEQQTRRIQCWRNFQVIDVEPNISFESIAGGRDFFCGLRSGGFSLLCWNSTFGAKRIYFNTSILLQDLTIGDGQICALRNGTRNVICWRGDTSAAQLPNMTYRFRSISSGLGFSCGVLNDTSRVTCWGSNQIASTIEDQFSNVSMLNIAVGGNHACGLNSTGFIVCKGLNSSGQLDVPSSNSPYEYSGLALGANHSCAIRRSNHSVVCWGGELGLGFWSNVSNRVSFESIVAGLDFTCGVTTSNLSIICWGQGWDVVELSSLAKVLPGPCVDESTCHCGIYPLSQTLCSNSGTTICSPCDLSIPMPPTSPPPPPIPSPSPSSSPSSPSRGLRKGLLAFAIVGSIGAVSGICTIIYCLWTGVCCGHKKIHNSVQPTITGNNSNGGQTSNNSPPSRSATIRRQSSRAMRRQRSGTSSKHADRAEEFTFSDLVAATDNFSLENKIGAGSFGVVYKGKLIDGREVAIKRGETSPKMKKFQEKESAFDSELVFLSRLHHKHLVRLVGYCEERDERLLVYEYMKNGALYNHLHDKNNVEKSSSLLNSWKMRIKISLDAARGIEYLHNYAVPPIIHRDIKSSNILLDANWTARVSDFGLSLMGPESDRDYRPMKAAGTVGYIDPEYYGLNVLTAKSDVYGLGVVLLELLTGKRAIFKTGDNGGAPVSVVDYAVPTIMIGEWVKILDPRVGPPELNEAEAVELVAYTAAHCVNLEGRDRPTMADIVANLERALSLCDGSHGSISSGPISNISE